MSAPSSVGYVLWKCEHGMAGSMDLETESMGLRHESVRLASTQLVYPLRHQQHENNIVTTPPSNETTRKSCTGVVA